MAGSFSPVLQEAEARIYPIGGYEDNSARYLGQRIGSMLEDGAQAFASLGTAENKLRPFAEQLEKIRQTSEQTDDNGRPLVANKRIRSDISALISQAYIEGGEDIGRQLSGAADNIFSGTLGSFTNDRVRQAEETFIGTAIDKGMVLLPEGTPEEQFAAGLRHQQLETEMETVKARLSLAREQLSYDDTRRASAEAEALRGTWGVVQKGMNEVLSPFLRSIASTDFTDPSAMGEAKKALVLKEAEMRAWVSQMAAETGLNPTDTAALLTRTSEQIKSVSDGLEVLGAIPKEQFETISTMFGLNEMQMGSSVGNLFKMMGRTGATEVMINSGMLMDPRLSAQLGARTNEILLEDVGRSLVDTLQRFDYTNPGPALDVAVPMLTADLTEGDSNSFKTFSDSLRYIVRGALGANQESQLNTVDEVTSQKFLDNLDTAQYALNPKDMTDTVTDYYTFITTMMDRASVQLQTIANTHEGITVNQDGSVEWDGVLASTGQAIRSAGADIVNSFSDTVAGRMLGAPRMTTTPSGTPVEGSGLGPLGPGAAIIAGAAGEIDEYQAFQIAQRLSETYTRAQRATQFVESKMTSFLRNTRGLRNNNPGNIERTNIPWRGRDPNGTDTRFETFKTVDEGIRAIGRSIKTNAGRGMTVDQFINRWAPSNENNTSAYISRVESEVGVPAATRMSELDEEQVARLVSGIITVENGYNPFNTEFIKSAINLE